MSKLLHALLFTATIGCVTSAFSASQNYAYTPTDGVNEVKVFHGCFDDDIVINRPQIHVQMMGLSTKDVTVDTRTLVAGKPSSELITFRVKNKNSSLTVQFLSKDGPHCQQGVASIRFNDVTYHSLSDLKLSR